MKRLKTWCDFPKRAAWRWSGEEEIQKNSRKKTIEKGTFKLLKTDNLMSKNYFSAFRDGLSLEPPANSRFQVILVRIKLRKHLNYVTKSLTKDAGLHKIFLQMQYNSSE